MNELLEIIIGQRHLCSVQRLGKGKAIHAIPWDGDGSSLRSSLTLGKCKVVRAQGQKNYRADELPRR